MHLDPAEARPHSLLDRPPVDRRVLIAGAVTMVAVPIVAPLLALAIAALFQIPIVGPLLGLFGVVGWLAWTSKKESPAPVVIAGLVAVVLIPIVVPLALSALGVALSMPIVGQGVALLGLVACLGWMVRGAHLSADQSMGGIAMSLAMHAAPVAVWAIVMALSAAGIELGAAAPPPAVPIEEIVQAHFVQLGEIPDPHRLPDRQVPIMRTDVPDPHPAPSLEANPPPAAPRPDHPRQRDSVDDVLQRLSNDAQIFAERTDLREREGDPEGIEGGERHASEGDRYVGRLAAFFRRGWSVPSTIPDSQLSDLHARVTVQIHDDTTLGDWELTSPSGNPDFDESVRAQMTRLVASGQNIPPPPEEVANQYLGQSRLFSFNGRDAHR
jgi:hypothetical protein